MVKFADAPPPAFYAVLSKHDLTMKTTQPALVEDSEETQISPALALAPEPIPQSSGTYRPEIDGVRAIAVLAVILYHMEFAAFSGGFVGVDVFLVLSGFLIVGVVWRQLERGERLRFWDFYRRRILRLFPALIVVVAATLLAGAWVLLPSDLDQLGQMSATTMTYASNIWLWRNTGYFGSTAELLPLLHMWSLSVEEQFYLALPVVLLVVHRWFRTRGVALIAFLGALSFLLAQYFLEGRSSAVFYLTPFRAWEFVVGGILAVAALRPRGKILREVGAVAGLLLILVPVFAYGRSTQFPGVAAIPPVVGTALVLSCVNGPSGVVYTLLSWRPLATLGKLSYSLYLWHWPVLVLLRHVYGELVGIQMVAASAAMFALSWVTYRLVESPLRNPASPKSGVVLKASLTLSFVVLVAGVGLARLDGVPSRVSERVFELDRARHPELPFWDCFGLSPSRPGCLLGEQSEKPKWVLWGDSHALALAPGFHSYLADNRESALFVASSGCPPLLGVRSRDVHGGDSRCGELETRLLATLERNSSVRGVVMVGSWSGYLSSVTRRMGGADGEGDTARVFRKGLGRTIPVLRERGLAVLSVGPVPIQPWNVPLELARVARWNGNLRPAVTREEATRVEEPFTSVAKALSHGAGDAPARFVGLTEHFCGEAPGATCRFQGEEGPLYRDGGHLNVVGAHYAMEVIGPALDLLRQDLGAAASLSH